ncbi:hypothetical protein GHK92_03295 [Nocardioides sp. dk4132]|uniref:hypothetical protein n=1 Tax=unclassified Nocardioides TaxID=2615069 RepID=UPI0012951A31|nr:MULTISPECIES: hypothetical protein [unclassified Nocardioides]MQW74887.1 hypothetical protein [Nocardioides sp. dk4132]QGA07922.1 hypothetical protein GFH29_11315 [Nocardioides sp. dk884]
MTTHGEALEAPVTSTVNARTLLLPYTLALVAGTAVIQVLIALTGGAITVLAGALTAVVGAGVVAWLWRHYRQLTHVRFGLAIAHAIAFAVVTTSFNVHAVLRVSILGAGADGFEAAAHDLLSTPWFGATLLMSAAWGLGLLIHLTGSVLGRGWEH